MKNTLIFGEILFDIFKSKKILGGAPFNFASNLNNFGINIDFISAIGNDKLGENIKIILNSINFDTKNIQINNKYNTGEVNIEIKDNEASYEIKYPSAYDFIEFEKIKFNKKYDIIYFGTLATRNKQSFNTLSKILNKFPNSIKFYDINLRKFNKNLDDRIEKLLCLTDILKINSYEKSYLENKMNIVPLVKTLQNKYNISKIIITYGENGSEIYTKTSKYTFNENNEKFDSTKIIDTVGAGDMFSASFIYNNIIKNNNIAYSQKQASIDAFNVCTHKGATILF